MGDQSLKLRTGNKQRGTERLLRLESKGKEMSQTEQNVVSRAEFSVGCNSQAVPKLKGYTWHQEGCSVRQLWQGIQMCWFLTTFHNNCSHLVQELTVTGVTQAPPSKNFHKREKIKVSCGQLRPRQKGFKENQKGCRGEKHKRQGDGQ